MDSDSIRGIGDLSREHWWDNEVEAAWTTKQKALATFNQHSTLENLINLKRCSAIFLKKKKQNIKESINKLAEEMDPQTSSSELWTRIRRLAGKRTSTRNNIIQDSPELAKEFMDLNLGPSDVHLEEASSCSLVSNYDIIDQDKWDNILSRKKSSAPGVDRITYDMLKSLKPEVTKLILIDLNRYWRQGSLPDHLKEIRIIAVPKPGKDNTTAAGNRPIALVPTLTKTINTAVLDGLNKIIDSQELLPKLSFGFRKGQSTNTCTTYITNLIQENRRKGLTAIGVFLDLSNAFNAVRTETLQQIMQELRIPQKYICWISGFLRNRVVTIRSGEDHIRRVISNGLPQGDVLSPTLFNIYTIGLHNTEDAEVVLVQYADDFSLIVTGSNLEIAKAKAQTYLDRFDEKPRELNLAINPEKSKAMLFKATYVELGLKIGQNYRNSDKLQTPRNLPRSYKQLRDSHTRTLPEDSRTIQHAKSHRKSNMVATRRPWDFCIKLSYEASSNASKIEESCGIGVFCEFTNRSISLKLELETCITTAELFAILVALNHLNDENIVGAVLFTDSLSSCQMIEGDIIEIASSLKVTIQWIPSHIGIKGNDIADELAKAGANSEEVLENGIFKHDAFNIFNQNRKNNTNHWYTTYAEEKGKHFFSIQPHYSDAPWYKNKQLNNREVRTLNRLMAGHSYANNWLAKMKIIQDPECDVCLTEDTADHVILHCNKYALTRSEFDFDGKFWTLIDIFKTQDLQTFRDLVHFLRKVKLDL
ncbi:uncharacterized protein LOC134222318 [Armigeres subalbatus]|uniref:uncharacterized protein LOC134222318 n=1 Tax=Armigeres subalbatus TaxID=124917 RepID=UPI002ED558A1